MSLGLARGRPTNPARDTIEIVASSFDAPESQAGTLT
jgi:hypothetical protein